MRGLVGSAAFTGRDPLRVSSQQPDRRVIMIIGDSNFAGFSAGLDNATGFRSALQRLLQEAGVRFRMVGRGFGAPNGTGTSWGRFPRPEDFQERDKPIAHIADHRHWGFGGRRLSLSNVVTAIDATANTLTVPGHTLTVGVACTLDFSGTDDPPVFAVDQPVYYAATVAGDVISLAQYEGSTTPIDITSAGSGTVRLNEGLIEMLPGIAEANDEDPTDIIVGGGTNDISNLIATLSAAETLAILQARETEYQDLLDELFPDANIFRVSVLDFMDDTAAAIAASSVVHDFNEWLADQMRARGRRWTLVEATDLVAMSAYSDNVHLTRNGYEAYGGEIARSIIQSVGAGLESAKVPRALARRSAQACIELRSTSDKAVFAAQTALNPGANPFFYFIWYMPFVLATGTNVILMQESPYNDGCMVTMNGTRLSFYHKSAGAGAILSSAYTDVLRAHRWHRIAAFIDPVRNEAALYMNARLLQRVHLTTGSAAITSQDGWALGAHASFASALGLYQGFVVGHGAGLSIEDFRDYVEADYYDGKDHPGATYKAKLDEGSGSTLASLVHDTTSGSFSAARWSASGTYPKPMDDGFKRLLFDSRTAAVTSAMTATYGERIPCDPTSAGFTITLPTAVGHDGEQIGVYNPTASTNVVTLDGAGSETVDGSLTISGTSTARGSRTIEARGGNWVTVATS